MLAGLEYDQTRPSNLGCFSCADFGHQSRECTIKSSKLRCTTCKLTGHVADVCPETHTWIKSFRSRSRSSSANRTCRQSGDDPNAKVPTPQDKPGNNGTNRRTTTPGPSTRVIPPAGETTAYFALGETGHQTKHPGSRKLPVCFHSTFPDEETELPMIQVATWSEKDDAPAKWLRKGISLMAVADTGCTRTLVSEEFVQRLGPNSRPTDA